MFRYIVPLIFGLVGTAVLVSLGTWQLRRVEWKEAILADIDARIMAAPTALPDTPDPEADRFLPVRVSGTFGDDEILVLVSVKQVGPGYRVIAPFETTDGRRIMVDRGFIPTEDEAKPRGAVVATLVGNLHWPDEIDGYTPEPDLKRGIWFARDVPAMAKALDTEDVLLILSATSEPEPAALPLPVDSAGIPNDHLGYAIQWFGLAMVWFGMTGFFLWRLSRRRN